MNCIIAMMSLKVYVFTGSRVHYLSKV